VSVGETSGCHVLVTAFPLSIFAPDSVQQQLFDFLLQYFDNCQSDG